MMGILITAKTVIGCTERGPCFPEDIAVKCMIKSPFQWSIFLIQSSVVITPSSITLYYIHHYSDWSRVLIRIWIHKRQPISRPNRWALGCPLWGFKRKLVALERQLTVCHCRSKTAKRTSEYYVGYLVSIQYRIRRSILSHKDFTSTRRSEVAGLGFSDRSEI